MMPSRGEYSRLTTLRARLPSPTVLVSRHRRLIRRHAGIADDAKRASRQSSTSPATSQSRKTTHPDQTSVNLSPLSSRSKLRGRSRDSQYNYFHLPVFEALHPKPPTGRLSFSNSYKPALSRQCCDLGCGSLESLTILPKHNDFLHKQLLPLYNHSETVYWIGGGKLLKRFRPELVAISLDCHYGGPQSPSSSPVLTAPASRLRPERLNPTIRAVIAHQATEPPIAADAITIWLTTTTPQFIHFVTTVFTSCASANLYQQPAYSAIILYITKPS